MPSLLCLVVDHGPYGSIEPAEAIRHAGGALGKGWDVVLALMGNGVYTALPGQSPPSGDWVSLDKALATLISEGKERAHVLVDGSSLAALGLSTDDLIPGARPASLEEIARAMADCDRTLLF